MNYLKPSSLILAGVCSLLLGGCNDSSPNATVAMNVQPADSTYYSQAINGPRYSVISVQNPSSNSSATINTLSLQGNSFSIVNRTSQTTDVNYGNYAECTTSANPAVNQVNTLAGGGECIIIVKGALGNAASAPDTGTLSITASSNTAVNHITGSTTQTFNLTNTTYLYAGGNFSSIGGNATATGALLAKCTDGSCQNYFGNNSNLGANNPTISNNPLAFSKLAVDSLGNLYVSGNFSTLATAMSSSANTLLAKCADGSCQNYFGDTASGATPIPGSQGINSIIPDSSGNIYAGGGFNTLGSATANSDSDLLARCANGTCYNYFGDNTSGATPIPGDTEGINSIVSDSSGNIYVGGTFDALGSASVAVTTDALLAKCANSTCYNYFADGTSGASSYITTMATDANGNLYVGGAFNTLGSASTTADKLIARCANGTCYNYFGVADQTSGASAGFATMFMDPKGNLYVTGYFKTLGDATASTSTPYLLAKCTNDNGTNPNGTCQNYFGDSVSGADAPINAMVMDANGNLYLGGYFKNLGDLGAGGTYAGAGSNYLLAECPAGGNTCINYFGDSTSGANDIITTLAIGNEISVVPQQ